MKISRISRPSTMKWVTSSGPTRVIYRLIESGELAGRKVGNKYRTTEAACIAYLSSPQETKRANAGEHKGDILCPSPSEAACGTVISLHRQGKELGNLLVKQAQELHDKLKAEAWRVDQIVRTFEECCIRWLREKDHKRSLDDDKTKIEFWLQHFSDRDVSKITAEEIHESVNGMPRCARVSRFRSTNHGRFLRRRKRNTFPSFDPCSGPRRMTGAG